MDLLGLSRALIAADTVSHHGTASAVALLRPLYESAGLATQIQEVVREGVKHQNLLGTFPGTDPAGLLLVTHLDTVDPGPLELWTETQGQPFELTKKDDRVYGLGSADTKLDALCKLLAARDFRGKPLRRSLQLLGTFEEEVGCKGARHFAQSPELRARFVSCSEPSELRLIRAHKGYAVVRVRFERTKTVYVKGPFERIVFEGKAAHSSTPHLGINAIHKALAASGTGAVVSMNGGSVSNKVPVRCTVVRTATGAASSGEALLLTSGLPDSVDATESVKLAQALYAWWESGARALRPERNDGFDPATTIVNWGVVKVDGAQGEVVFDCRLLPGHSPEAFLNPFIEGAQRLAHEAGATLSVDVERSNPAMELALDSELLTIAQAACRDVGLNDAPQAKPTNTEAGVFAHAGKQAMVFGPGRSTGNAHTANEHNLYSQMEQAVHFYRALITRLCV